MKGYVKRRLDNMVPRERPKLFSSKGYLTDLDSMLQGEYVSQLEGADGVHGEAMIAMLTALEIKERTR